MLIEKMLPRLQDTVLICKGWYNKEKYPNEYEALRAYWATIAEVSVKNIGYDAVLQCLLLPACEAFLCNRKFCELFYERIYKLDIVMREFEKIKKHKNNAEYREMNAEYLIEILTDALFALRNDEFSFKERPRKMAIVWCKKWNIYVHSCGLSSDNLEDFEEDFQNHQGFWCPRIVMGSLILMVRRISGLIRCCWKIKEN